MDEIVIILNRVRLDCILQDLNQINDSEYFSGVVLRITPTSFNITPLADEISIQLGYK